MSSEKKVLHPNLIGSDADLAAANLAPGTFYFTGSEPMQLRQVGVEDELNPDHFLYLYAHDLMILIRLGKRPQYSVQPHEIVTDLILNPKNAEFFLAANSAYRRLLVNKPDLIRQMIQKGKPELHYAIRKYGLIDTVRFPWRRNELYRALEAAEKTDPSEFILRRYFEASDNGYYARKRQAKYKTEADELPVEFKVAFILKNPERADYFFDDEVFKRDLISKRPDLVFKLIELKEKLVSRESDLRYKLFSDAILDAALKVGTFKDIKQLQDLLDDMKWTMQGHPLLRLNVDKAAESAASKDKGKEESSSHKPFTAKVEIKSLDELNAVLDEYKDFTRLEIFLPEGILVVDNSSRQKKVNYYTDQMQYSLRLSEYFSEVVPTVVLLSSHEFLDAFQRKISPDTLPKQSPSSGFFGRFMNWWRNRNATSTPQRVLKASLPRVKTSHELIAGSLTSASEDDIQNSEERGSPIPKAKSTYKNARDEFLAGNYEEAMKLFDEMFLSFEGEYTVDPNVSVKGYDSVSLTLAFLLEILRKNNANFLDVFMIDELMLQKKAQISLANLTQLQSALHIFLGQFDYSHVDYRILPKEWQIAFQLFMLERNFLTMEQNKNDFAGQREVNRLQEKYLALVKSSKQDPLVQAMAKRSHLLNYDSGCNVSKARITVINMFEKDPANIQQMFNVLEDGQLKKEAASKFVSETVAKVGIYKVMYYIREPYHCGLNILIENSAHFRELLLKNNKLMLDIAGYGVPEMRQALRNPKLTLPEAVKIALTTAVEKDVEAVCRDVSEA
ncbi:MAG: hypothetical protein SFW07_05185, partial [Gammaproteobacteria bacterium]|nr:hypothetical protein [Gammaproteobacteria bacterium]